MSEFYNALAPDYDAMTGFEKRFIAERPFFRMLVERFGITSAIDAGCGTGFHSLVLAQLGVSVTAVDVSQKMLDDVVRHAKEFNLHVETVAARFQTLAQVIHKQHDAVFCLGNSLAHLLDDQSLADSLKSFAALLKPEGVLFVQILNYAKILSQRQRVQNVKDVGPTTFIRFYDFEPALVRFNILKLERRGVGIEHSMDSIALRPLRQSDLVNHLAENGFDDVRFYGGISLEEFHPETSKDLVILARNTGHTIHNHSA